MRRIFLLLTLCFFTATYGWGENSSSSGDSKEAETAPRLPMLIDTPNAETIDQYGYLFRFRFYSQGGVLTQTTFGVFPHLNLGFGIDVERLIGSTTDGMKVNRPSINLKWRFFDGRDVFPALAVGYDSQGYYFDHDAGEYAQREHGLYLVGTKEIITPGLDFSGGIYTFKFSNGNEVHGFLGASYAIRDVAAIFVEWDNMGTFSESRYNVGFRFFVNPSFSVDAYLRNGRGTIPPSDSRRTDRNIQLNYQGSF